VDSRYIRIVKTPILKRKRVRKIHGAFEDRGKYFNCWVCGAINSTERNISSDGYGNEGTDFITKQGTPSEQYQDLGREAGLTLNIEFFGEVGTIVKLGLDGNPISTYYTERHVENSKGCWFCGSTNIF
jgi:hypothetical protein